MPVFAANEGEASDTKLTVNKTVRVPEGVTIDNKDITFKVEKLLENADGVAAPEKGSISVDTANFEGLTSANANDLTKQLKITERDLQTGEYIFKIEENTLPELSDGYGWTNISEKTAYYLHIYVENKDQKKYIVTTDNKLNENGSALNQKASSIDFTNQFTEKAQLSITKTVRDQTYETPGQKYQFTVTFDTDDLNSEKKCIPTPLEMLQHKLYPVEA